MLQPENLAAAWKQVKANKGAAGIDGMGVGEFPAFVRKHWETIRLKLLEGVYEPSPVKRVWIPKPDGSRRGPLSPLLANVLLDELDHELEARGHRFVRYADDFVILCTSPRAGRRILERVRRFLQKSSEADRQRGQEQGGGALRGRLSGLSTDPGPRALEPEVQGAVRSDSEAAHRADAWRFTPASD
jgi:retron-type reverse transcriptase